MDAQSNANNNPMKQPVDLASVNATDPAKPNQGWKDIDENGKPKNENKVDHQALSEASPLSDSGRDIGLVHAPVQSLHPTSGNQLDKADGNADDFKLFDNPNRYLNHKGGAPMEFKYPFAKMDIDQGFFVPVEKGSTTDKLMATLEKQVNSFREQSAECEKDENGDDVWESVVIQTKKRKDDIIQLDGMGKPIVGANQTNRPKLIFTSNFIVRAVVKGDPLVMNEDEETSREAETDGALVIRVI